MNTNERASAAIILNRGKAVIRRARRRLARHLDPDMYAVAKDLNGCLRGLTEELYEDRYNGVGTPGSCCYQSVLDYEEATRG